jgi:uncharacterized membrane protein (UPF0127 family)
MRLVNSRTRSPIAGDVELAFTSADRRRGLLGRDGLAAARAMILSPCWAIHTAFMRFSIDVLFVDREWRAVRIVRRLRPWRAAFAPKARAVVELPAGTLGSYDVLIGDRLYLTDRQTGSA